MSAATTRSASTQANREKTEHASASLQSAESILAQALAFPLRAVRFGLTMPKRVMDRVSCSAHYAQTVAEAYAPAAVKEYTQGTLVPLAKDCAAATKGQVYTKTQGLVRWAQAEGRTRAPEKVVHAVEQTMQQLDGMRGEARQLADKSQDFVEATIQDPNGTARSLASTIVRKAQEVLPVQVQEIISVWSDVAAALYMQSKERVDAMRADIAVQYKANVAWLREARITLADKASAAISHGIDMGKRIGEAISPRSYIDLSREQSIMSALEQLVRDISKNPYVVRIIDGIDKAVVSYMPVGIASWTRRTLPRYINGHDADLQREHETDTACSTAVDDQGNGNMEKRKKKKKTVP